ncbi:MAG TPA: hypothetical protein VNJ08_17765 [Bacteriovoracaceae bacterium]|nr:hypothetical protein [Bacteriovoracaceae bacterium]
MDEVSNQPLLQNKIAALDSQLPTDFAFAVSCNYHGINLDIKTRSLRLVNSIKNLVPDGWLESTSSECRIFVLDPLEFGHTPESWSDESSQDCLTFEENTIAIQRDFAARIFQDHVLLICEDKVGDGFYNFLRWYLSEKLMLLNKYVVHASCVLDKHNNAHLFLGHSGAGKTTITKLSHPRSVLGDDMNLISIDNNTLQVEAGALGGQFNSMIGYDTKRTIVACYWLNQAKANEKKDLGPLSANIKLLASFANLHWPTLPEERINQLIGFASTAASVTKFYQLNFLNTQAIWEFLDP